MITLRPAAERGHANHGWLDTWHTFSYADYHDPAHTSFRDLRVINEDWVEPGAGFGTHPHRDMEIITYVLGGALEHKDSMGSGSIIRPGDVQRMSAGTGVTHSEFNPSDSERVHLLQIWILPEHRGLTPEYEQKTFPEPERRNRLRLVAARDGREGALTIHQDVDLYAAVLDRGTQIAKTLGADRYAWLQVVRGALVLNGLPMKAGDGAAVSGEPRIDLRADTEAEALLFDLA